MREITPVLYEKYRIARLRSRIVTRERARLARRLHDFTIQSLIGTEMRLQIIRRQWRRTAPASLMSDLSRIQTLLHGEILNLRDLMVQMKPVDVTAEELPDFLCDQVGRFAHDTGIDATFKGGHLASFHVSKATCAEIARLVQEGLSNVRKHSGAKHALVRLEPTAGGLFLVIEDDGRGFSFEGRVRLASHHMPRLDGAAAAPSPATHTLEHQPRSWELAVIKESVRAVGGGLVVRSSRGRGAGLEIFIPAHRGRETSRARIAS